jgi:4-amino-4-deoxy-L-arabinose transferase-like glycosyltransferase
LFVIPVVAYIVCAVQRLGTPIELEWMEGGSLQMMYRVLSGKPLYAPPSIEFVPYTYTPLYFYLSALVSFLVGADFLPLRLVSFTASLASFFFLFAIIRRETGSALAGVAAAGLFAGSYAVNGNWFDIARIDSLCVAFLLSGIWFALGRGRAFELIAGGLLVALAFFCPEADIVSFVPPTMGLLSEGNLIEI